MVCEPDAPSQPPPRTIEPPGRYPTGAVGDQVEVVYERRQPRCADHAIGQQAGDGRALGCETELVGHESHASRNRRGIVHRLGLCDIERERLLAHDMRAGAERFEHQRQVDVRWCRDGDGIEPKCDRVGERGAGVRNIHSRCAPSRSLLVATDERDDVEPRGAQRRHMHATPESRPDDGGSHRDNARTWLASATQCPTGSASGQPYSGKLKYSTLNSPR